MSRKKSMKSGLCLTAVILLAVLASGCSSLQNRGPSAGGAPLYYDGFNDILIPGELKADKGASSMFQSGGFSAGIMVFQGRVGRGALVSFFKENMAKDNWQLIGSITSPKTILLFQKEVRWCMINITEGSFNTQVEIAVIPSTGGEASQPLSSPPPQFESSKITE